MRGWTTLILLVVGCPLIAAEPPRRVVSLAPNLTQIVQFIGGADLLIAVTPFCDAPESIQRIPGGIQPEAEVVLGLDPDLILTTSMTPATTQQQMRDLGLRVEKIDVNSLSEISDAMDLVARIFAVPCPPAHQTKFTKPGPSAALLFGTDAGYSAGHGTYAHEILEAAGLRNIAVDASGPWPQLSEEFILAADPEVIIVADYESSTRDKILRKFRSHNVRRYLSAVKNGNVLVFPSQKFSIPGPEALDAPQELREALSSP